MVDPANEDEKLIRQRQRSGARVTALLLGGFILLVFLITIAKLTINQ